MSLPEKVLVITGGTSGIGLSFLERLLLETRFRFILNICILCRNLKKGEFVRSTLLLSHRSAKISLIKTDTGDIPSVLNAIEQIKDMYTHIDYLYLNAGILPVKKLNVLKLLSRKIVERLRTGEEVFELENPLDEYGIPSVFSTNILGHFFLANDLMPLLQSSGTASKIVWTTSNNATKSSFSFDDFLCKNGPASYGSSKYIMNGVSIALNEKHKVERSLVHSCLAEPGLVVSNMSGQLLPGWLWRIVTWIFMLLRFFASHFTLSTHNGSEALLWLFKQDPKMLHSNYQYTSSVNIFNQLYVKNIQIDISLTEADQIYQKMSKVAENVRVKVNTRASART